MFDGIDVVARHRRVREPFTRVVEPGHFAGLMKPHDATAPAAPLLTALGRSARRLRRRRRRCGVTEIVRARVEERLTRLRLGAVASRLDTIRAGGSRGADLSRLPRPVLAEEPDAKQKKRVAMGIQIAHFPTVKTARRVRLQVPAVVPAAR